MPEPASKIEEAAEKRRKAKKKTRDERRNKFLENMESIRHLGNQKGREPIATREAAFYKAISEGLGVLPHSAEKQLSKASKDDLSEIKSQLSELQEKLRKLEE